MGDLLNLLWFKWRKFTNNLHAYCERAIIEAYEWKINVSKSLDLKFDTLMPGGDKSSYIFKQTSSF